MPSNSSDFVPYRCMLCLVYLMIPKVFKSNFQKKLHFITIYYNYTISLKFYLYYSFYSQQRCRFSEQRQNIC